MKKPIPFGKYYLLERINVGGMAEIFKAKATGVEGFERVVAVKRILPSIAEDEEFITMFIDEAKIAVQLQHANIAQIFDLGNEDDSYYIAMEYVHGKDLRAMFNRARNRGEPLPLPLACYVIMKVCEGLDYAHNKKDAAGRPLNLVHRDVSPQNILISYDGEIKVIDFGIAKAAGKAGKTQAGILKGKFGYMSPEQVQGQEIDRRSDIFGLGICLYELLTGERLFVGESDFATLEMVRNVDIMPPSTYNRRIAEELEQIVLKALAKSRDDRYQSALDLHDDLQSFMYESGNQFSRKDLSRYMRETFAAEMEKESASDASFAKPGAASNETTGLAAFDDLDPVSTVSGLTELPGQHASAGNPHGAPANRAANVSQPQVAPHKSTLMGMPAAPPTSSPPASPSSRPSMPPPPPTSQPPSGSMPPPPPTSQPPSGSMPPPPPTSQPPADSSHSLPPAGVREPTVPGLDMDWDDEEMSTQIYDRPEHLQEAIASGPTPQARGSVPPHESIPPQTPPPRPSSAPPGIPAPFDGTDTHDHPGFEGPADMMPSEDATGSSRKSVMLAVGAAAAILLLVAGGLAIFGGSSTGSIHLSTKPADAQVLFNGEPVSGASSPYVVTNVEPDETHTLEVTKDGYKTWSAQVEIESGQTLELPSVELDPAGTGTGFVLGSVPSGAEVFVDGEPLDQKTPVRATNLSPGKHTVRIEREGYAPWQTQIQVAGGQVIELPEAKLARKAVSVHFTSDPEGAKVALERDSERRTLGTTPVDAEIELSGGAWTVEMTKEGFEPFSRELDVEPGDEEVEVAAELEREERDREPARARRSARRERSRQARPERRSAPSPSPSAGQSGEKGTLRLNTTPWSQVFVDGQLIGNTPQMGMSLSPGRHRVTLVNPDFGIRKTITVTVKPGQTQTKILRLSE